MPRSCPRERALPTLALDRTRLRRRKRGTRQRDLVRRRWINQECETGRAAARRRASLGLNSKEGSDCMRSSPRFHPQIEDLECSDFAVRTSHRGRGRYPAPAAGCVLEAECDHAGRDGKGNLPEHRCYHCRPGSSIHLQRPRHGQASGQRTFERDPERGRVHRWRSRRWLAHPYHVSRQRDVDSHGTQAKWPCVTSWPFLLQDYRRDGWLYPGRRSWYGGADAQSPPRPGRMDGTFQLVFKA